MKKFHFSCKRLEHLGTWNPDRDNECKQMSRANVARVKSADRRKEKSTCRDIRDPLEEYKWSFASLEHCHKNDLVRILIRKKVTKAKAKYLYVCFVYIQRRICKIDDDN